MDKIQQFSARCIWMMIAIAAAGALSVNTAHAQQTGSTVDECSSGEVDYNTAVEETVCLYGNREQ